jgi:hypothetical protein
MFECEELDTDKQRKSPNNSDKQIAPSPSSPWQKCETRQTAFVTYSNSRAACCDIEKTGIAPRAARMGFGSGTASYPNEKLIGLALCRTPQCLVLITLASAVDKFLPLDQLRVLIGYSRVVFFQVLSINIHGVTPFKNS